MFRDLSMPCDVYYEVVGEDGFVSESQDRASLVDQEGKRLLCRVSEEGVKPGYLQRAV